MAFSKAIGGSSVDNGVRVLAVNPGPVDTDRIRTMLKTWAEEEFGDPERWPELTKKYPMGRAAKPEECADLVVFAASARASYISGVVLTIDCGAGARP